MPRWVFDPDVVHECAMASLGIAKPDMFDAFAEAARKLDDWHAAGRRGPRPPGRLRPYRPPRLSRFTRAWASELYRTVYDPDGRPPALRRKGEF